MAIELKRYAENPILTPQSVTPSHPDLEVVGAFNAGAATIGDEVVLLVRVAERPRPADPDSVGIPSVDLRAGEPRITVQWVSRRSPDVDLSDPRGIVYRGRRHLSSISHLRLARSRDGFHFDVDPVATILPATPYEAYGLEDPRITQIGDTYYVAYTSPSPAGVAVSLLKTADFRRFQRMGVILAPENKDVAIFSDRSSGRFAALHRPAGPTFGDPDIWTAYSPDLIHWGDHHRVLPVRPGSWDGARVGAGAVPLETPEGWLEIYHGAVGNRYCLGTALLDRDHPHRLLARSPDPIMTPIEPYELRGFFGAVVFTCGAVRRPDGTILVYYGASDSSLGVAIATESELLSSLEPVSEAAVA